MSAPCRHTLRRALAVGLVLLGTSLAAMAHLNAPHIYVEQSVASYPLIAVVEMPPAVPGEAELQVLFQDRDSSDIPRLELLEIPPQGEQAAAVWQPLRRSDVDGNFYTARISLTVTGLWRARVRLTGDRGQGEFEIPIAARIPIPRVMDNTRRWILGVLGSFLAISLFYIGVGLGRDSVRPVGQPVSRANRRWGLIMGLLCVVGLGMFLWFIANFWRDYHAWHHVQAEPGMSVRVFVTGDEAAAGVPAEVNLELNGPRNSIVRDLTKQRGKWLHVGVVEIPSGGYFMAAHPRKINQKTYRFVFTPPRPGVYKVFTNVLTASGESETFADVLNVGIGIDPIDFPFDDPADAHAFAPSFAELGDGRGEFSFEDGFAMRLTGDAGPFQPLRPVRLGVELVDPEGDVLELEPYLGQAGRLMLMREDGNVFMHVSETGTVGVEGDDADSAAAATNASFPFGFPSTGTYRLWAQVRHDGQVRTGVFDVVVAEP